MALQTSGAISLNNVNVELGNSATAYTTMGSAAVRGLFGVASGAISLSDGYGASDTALRFEYFAGSTEYALRPASHLTNPVATPGAVAAIIHPTTGDLYYGFQKSIGSDYKWLTAVGTSNWFAHPSSAVWDYMTVCKFNLDGSIAENGSIAWVGALPGNPTYNVPDTTWGNYASMDSAGTLTIGVCQVLGVRNVNYFATVADVLYLCENNSINDVNNNTGTLTLSIDSMGLVWTNVQSPYDWCKSYDGQNRGIIWST